MKVCNLTKTYKLKHERVEALKGLSFDLSDKGMVFVLGKSGCGKSTLLNVLSGLDNFDEGDVIFNGKSLKNFSEIELDSYRNAYCGFVFQEYNLLPELNASENIALALDLQGEKDATQKISLALKKVGLEGYEDRKVSEMSGGQKQRIAIARSIVKDPQIIFADEPSGALDSETGELVFSLLKELSKDRLVIVVSHDNEAANKYGDRIIELADGRIVCDTDKDYRQDEGGDEYKVFRPKMPVKSALKIGCSNFKYHPIRLIATVFLAMIAFSFLGISLNPVVDDISTIMYSTMEKNGLNQSAILKQIEKDDYRIPLFFTEQERQEVQERANVALPVRYCESGIENLGALPEIPYYVLPQSFSRITESEIAKCGFILHNSLPKNNNEIAITAYTAEIICKGGIGNEGEITYYDNATDLVGKILIVDGDEFIISGIVDTNLDTKKYSSLKNENYNENLYDRFISELSYATHNLLFVSENDFDDENSFKPQSVILRRELLTQSAYSIELFNSKYDVCVIGNQDGIYLPKGYIIDFFIEHSNFDILKTLSDEHWNLHCDEYYEQAKQNGFNGTIEAFYQTVFNTRFNSYGISSADIYYKVISENEELFTAVDCAVESLTLGYKQDFKIKGFYNSDNLDVHILADKEIYDEIYKELGGIYSHLVVMQNLIGRSNFNYYTNSNSEAITYQLSNFVIETVKGMEDKINTLKSVMVYLSIAFAVFSVVLLLNFMMHSISEKSNTIGILKSLGCSNFNLVRIFILEGLIIGALVFAASLGGLALFGWFFSMYFSSMYGSVYVAIFGVTPIVTLILFGTIVVFAIMGCILPIVRLSKLKPMEYLNKII